MCPLSSKALEILAALRAASEGEKYELSDGRPCRDVYVDNGRPEGMSRRAFAGYLSKLARAGLYKPHDGSAWGIVVLSEGIRDA